MFKHGLSISRDENLSGCLKPLAHPWTLVPESAWTEVGKEVTNIQRRVCETEPIKHSTVQTLLRTLVKRGAVAYDVDDRTFIFYPLVENLKVEQHALQDVIDRIFEGSAENLILSVVKNKYISPKELEKIRELLDKGDS